VSHKPGTGLDAVNPEFSETLQAMLKAGAMPELSSATLPQMRVGMAAYTPPLLPAPEVMKRTIPGPKSSPDVTVYVTGAKSGASKPAVLHMHGGGYIAGSAQMNRPDMQELALKHDCVAVSVEYRLAPETPFPGSLEDNYAGLQWLYKNATELGVDRSRIAIKGESAGGGHAAALAIRARDIGEIPICLQVLVYPMLDDRTASTVPAPASVGKYVWTPANNRFGWTSLLGRPAGSSQAPPNSVPARVNDLTGLPPAWIGVGSIDLFAAEDLTYGRRLLEAGVSTEIQVVPGAFHGFDLIAPQAPLSIAFAQSWNTALARAFKQQV
jgi:acetyl esterase/lipase